MFILCQPSPFFTEQMTAFEVWLDHGSENKKPPEQLPIVLQVWHFSRSLFFGPLFGHPSLAQFLLFSLCRTESCSSLSQRFGVRTVLCL
jgi:hypothetical protein